MSRTKKRKPGRGGSAAAASNKSRKLEDRAPKEVLDQFWSLSDSNDQVRQNAAAALANTTTSSMTADPEAGKQGEPIHDYVLQRLITGATSSRDDSRQGFALALASICKQADDDTVTERGLALVHKTWTKARGESKEHSRERREATLGCLFCCAALARGSYTLSEDTAQGVLKMLRQVASEQQSWCLGTAVVTCVSHVLENLEKSGSLESVQTILHAWMQGRSGKEDGALLHQLCLLRNIRVPASLGREVPRHVLEACFETGFRRTDQGSPLPWLWAMAIENAARESSQRLRSFWTDNVMSVFVHAKSMEKILAMFWVIPLVVGVAPTADDIIFMLDNPAIVAMERKQSMLKLHETKLVGKNISSQLLRWSSGREPGDRVAVALHLFYLSLSSCLFRRVLKPTDYRELLGRLDYDTVLKTFVQLVRPLVAPPEALDEALDQSLPLKSDRALQIAESLLTDPHCQVLDEAMQFVLSCHGLVTLDNPQMANLAPEARKPLSVSDLRLLNRLVYSMFLKIQHNLEAGRALAIRLVEIAGNFRKEAIPGKPEDSLRERAIRLCLALQENKSGTASASILLCVVILLEAGTDEIVKSVGQEFLDVVENEIVSNGELFGSFESQLTIVDCILSFLHMRSKPARVLLSATFAAIGHVVTEQLIDSMLKRILDDEELDEDGSDVDAQEDSVDEKEDEEVDGSKDGDDESDDEMPTKSGECSDEGEESDAQLDTDVNLDEENEAALAEYDKGLASLVKGIQSSSKKAKEQDAEADMHYRLRVLDLLSELVRCKDCPMSREVVLPPRLVEFASKCSVDQVVDRALALSQKFMKSKKTGSSATAQTLVLELERISSVLCSKFRPGVSEEAEKCLFMLCRRITSLPTTESEALERMLELVSGMLGSFEANRKRIAFSEDTLVKLIRRQPVIGAALVDSLSGVVLSGRSQYTRSVAVMALTTVLDSKQGAEKSEQIEGVFHAAVQQGALTEPKRLKVLLLLGTEGARREWDKQKLSKSVVALEEFTRDHRELEKLQQRLYNLSLKL